jgi:hypothetical protein
MQLKKMTGLQNAKIEDLIYFSFTCRILLKTRMVVTEGRFPNPTLSAMFCSGAQQ